MKKSNELVKTTELTADELPDWSGMRETSARGTPEGAYKLCEEYLALFPVAVQNYRKQARLKCEVEFVL